MLKIDGIDLKTLGVTVLFGSAETVMPQIRSNFIDGKVGSANLGVSHGNTIFTFECNVKGDIRDNIEQVKLLFFDDNGDYKKSVKVEWDKWNNRYYDVLLNDSIELSPKSKNYGVFTLSLISVDALAKGINIEGATITNADLINSNEVISVDYKGSFRTGFSLEFSGLCGALNIETIEKDSSRKIFKYKENTLSDTSTSSAISGVAFSQTWQNYVSARAALNTEIVNVGGEIYREGANFTGKNLFKRTTATENRQLLYTGAISNSSTSFITDYIKVEAGTSMTFRKPAGQQLSRIGYYDYNRDFMSMQYWEADVNTITIPEYVHFIRWSPDSSGGKFRDGYMLNMGTVARDYAPSIEDIAVDVVRRASDNLLSPDDKTKMLAYSRLFDRDYTATMALAQQLGRSTSNLTTAYNQWQAMVAPPATQTDLIIDFNEFTVTDNGVNTLKDATGSFLSIGKNTNQIRLSGDMTGTFNIHWRELYI